MGWEGTWTGSHTRLSAGLGRGPHVSPHTQTGSPGSGSCLPLLRPPATRLGSHPLLPGLRSLWSLCHRPGALGSDLSSACFGAPGHRAGAPLSPWTAASCGGLKGEGPLQPARWEWPHLPGWCELHVTAPSTLTLAEHPLCRRRRPRRPPASVLATVEGARRAPGTHPQPRR